MLIDAGPAKTVQTTKYNNIRGDHFLRCRLFPVVVDHAEVSSDDGPAVHSVKTGATLMRGPKGMLILL